MRLDHRYIFTVINKNKSFKIWGRKEVVKKKNDLRKMKKKSQILKFRLRTLIKMEERR